MKKNNGISDSDLNTLDMKKYIQSFISIVFHYCIRYFDTFPVVETTGYVEIR